jgi:uncharacterized lipoprotein YmbA
MNAETVEQRLRPAFPILLSGLLLAGCVASAPTHYHTLLDPMAEPSSIRPSGFLVDMEPVDIPPQSDQPQLVVRSDDGGIQLLQHERWVAPLADELRNALSDDLVRELGTMDVARLSAPSALPVLRIKVDVRRFEATPGHDVSLDATWNLSLAGGTRPPLVCLIQEQRPTGSDYADVVKGQRRLLGHLASRIAAAAERYVAGDSNSCLAE